MRLLIITLLQLSLILSTKGISIDSNKVVFNHVVDLYDSCNAENTLLNGALKYSENIIDKQQDLLKKKQYEQDTLLKIIGTYKVDSTKYVEIIDKEKKIAKNEKRAGNLKAVGYGIGGAGVGAGLFKLIAWISSLFPKK